MNGIVIFDLKCALCGYPKEQVVRKDWVSSIEELERCISRSVVDTCIVGENGSVDVTAPFPPKLLPKRG
jgi:hypothetical protein